MVTLLLFLTLLTNQALAAPPQRVVSLSVGQDEILWQLLKQDRTRISALSSLAKDPRYSAIAKGLPPDIRTTTGALEELLLLRPDFVFAASYTNPDILLQLKKAEIPFQRHDHFHTLAQIASNVRSMAKVLQMEKQGEKMIQIMWQRVAKLHRPAKLPSCLNFDSQGVLYGPRTTFATILLHAGCRNEAERLQLLGHQKISLEALLTLNPDYIIVATEPNDSDTKSVIQKTKGWGQLPAVKAGRIVEVDSALFSSVSPAIVGAIVQLNQRLFHEQP